MRTVGLVDDAAARRARSAPTRTCGTEGSTGNPSPSSVMRPPSTAQSGRTEVTRPPVGARDGPTSRLGVALAVPVEALEPAVGCLRELDRDADRGRLVGTLRDANEMQAGLLGSASALAAVAGDAAGNDVLPVLSAALGDRHHMIEGQLRARQLLPAVLAGVLVAGVDVGA